MIKTYQMALTQRTCSLADSAPSHSTPSPYCASKDMMRPSEVRDSRHSPGALDLSIVTSSVKYSDSWSWCGATRPWA
jgi:hypothetical protein